jgi:hypothetical protein
MTKPTTPFKSPYNKRANLYSEGTDLFGRIPLLALPYLTRGFSPRGPAAVIGTAWQENNSIPSFFKGHRVNTKQRSRERLPTLFPFCEIWQEKVPYYSGFQTNTSRDKLIPWSLIIISDRGGSRRKHVSAPTPSRRAVTAKPQHTPC